MFANCMYCWQTLLALSNTVSLLCEPAPMAMAVRVEAAALLTLPPSNHCRIWFSAAACVASSDFTVDRARMINL